MTPPPLRDKEVFERMRSVLGRGWLDIPDKFTGTGAPGNYLEHLMGLEVSGADTPDAGAWELKFHGSSGTLITLFHNDPKGAGEGYRTILRKWGWPSGKKKLPGFRHTLAGAKSGLGFYVGEENDGVKHLAVYNKGHRDGNGRAIPLIKWRQDELINAATSKLRRLILVRGKTQKIPVRRVRYLEARLYKNIAVGGFIQNIVDGLICIDFDYRSTGKLGGLRNHGTKFRIKSSDIGRIYLDSQDF